MDTKNIKATIRRRLRTKVHCLGDSHVAVFRNAPLRNAFKTVNFEITSVGGATVSGLQNPNPKSGSVEQFNEVIELLDSSSVVIVCLGEVDTGFVIWWRAENRGLGIEEAYQQALDSYIQFLLRLRSCLQCIVISAPIPTIPDGVPFGDVANARSEITATLKERTELTLRFNRDIEKFCGSENFISLNLDSDLVDTRTGTVRERFLNHDRADHHYDASAYGELLASRLRSPLLRSLPLRLRSAWRQRRLG